MGRPATPRQHDHRRRRYQLRVDARRIEQRLLLESRRRRSAAPRRRRRGGAFGTASTSSPPRRRRPHRHPPPTPTSAGQHPPTAADMPTATPTSTPTPTLAPPPERWFERAQITSKVASADPTTRCRFRDRRVTLDTASQVRRRRPPGSPCHRISPRKPLPATAGTYLTMRMRLIALPSNSSFGSWLLSELQDHGRGTSPSSAGRLRLRNGSASVVKSTAMQIRNTYLIGLHQAEAPAPMPTSRRCRWMAACSAHRSLGWRTGRGRRRRTGPSSRPWRTSPAWST